MLFQVAALTVAIATAIDILLAIAIEQFGLGRLIVSIFLLPDLLPLVAAYGVGALGTVLLERLFRQTFITSNILWALVGCLMVILWVKSLLPIPALWVSLDYFSLMGMILGVFWQGRHYWRR